MANQFQEENRERRQLWQTHLDAWALTELSQVEYCQQNDLNYNRFTYWKRNFHKENLPVEFVRIPAEPFKAAPLLHNNGASLRLTVGSQFAL